MELVNDRGAPWEPSLKVREQQAQVCRPRTDMPMLTHGSRIHAPFGQMENSYGRIVLRCKVSKKPEHVCCQRHRAFMLRI
jgi:hypothetical protein